jgi:phosphate transport system substrate-binding protein
LVRASRNRIDPQTELFGASGAPRRSATSSRNQRRQHVRAHRSLILSLTIALALAVPAAAAAKQLIIGGSTSMLPLVQQLATAYHKAFPHIPKPKVGGCESDCGINGANSGEFDIGDSSRNPIPGVDPHGLHFTKVSQDGICIITNNTNAISELSKASVEGIFTGAIRDWSEIPGAKIGGPIDLYDRNGVSGTQDAFQHIFLGEEQKISPSATEEISNGLEQLNVHNDKQGIGFVSFAFTAGVNPVGYSGIPCTLRNARSGQYQGVRNFWFVTKGKPKGEAAKFIKWVIKPHNGTVEKIVNSQWISIY